MDVHERFKDYEKSHCWQYEIRRQNLSADIDELGLTDAEVKTLYFRF